MRRKHRILPPVQPLAIHSPAPAGLIFRNGKIGNTLMALPVLDVLRESLPGVRLDMVADRLGLDLLEGDERIRRFYVFERETDSLRRQWELVREFHRQRYDFSLHLRTGVRNELLAFLARIPNRVGTKLKGSFQFLTHIAPKRGDVHVHEALRLLLSQALGREIRLGPPRLREQASAGEAARAWLNARGLAEGRYLIFHPSGETTHGAEWALRWQSEAMRRLNAVSRLPVVVLGAAGEQDVILPALPQEPACIPLFGENLSLVSALIKRAGLFVGNDSGPAHLAEAWERPTIVLYRDDPDNFVKWAPLDRKNSLVLFASQTGQNWEDVETFATARLGRLRP